MRETDAEASVQFDKDDSETLDFVTATANLRARVYGIEEKSRFQVKGTDSLQRPWQQRGLANDSAPNHI